MFNERVVRGCNNRNLKMIRFMGLEYGITETETTHFQAIRSCLENLTEQKVSETDVTFKCHWRKRRTSDYLYNAVGENGYENFSFYG